MAGQHEVIKWNMLAFLAGTDDSGVWEALQDVRNIVPSLSKEDAIEAGAVAAIELIDDGLAEMYYVTGGWAPWEGVEKHPASREVARSFLKSKERTTVVVEREGEERAHWLRSTDAGVEKYHSLAADDFKISTN